MALWSTPWYSVVLKIEFKTKVISFDNWCLHKNGINASETV